ncbi:MAG: nitroreductase family protein [Dysgonomonas sp.]
MKKRLKKILPSFIQRNLKKYLVKYQLLIDYYFDYKRYYKYSSTKGLDTEVKLISEIIKAYHGIEKGLAMSPFRLGFGQDKVVALTHECLRFYNKYPRTNMQFRYAISVLLEYETVHVAENFEFAVTTQKALSDINKIAAEENIRPSCQLKYVNGEYFKNTKSEFSHFSNSRKSVRDFSSENVSINDIKDAIRLATNTPSACNRQATKTYVYTDKKQIAKILAVQNGNRGFGHLVNKLVVITSDLSAFVNPYERYQAYIDGGIYTMNLLYALHYYEIAACTLNCSHTHKIDKNMKSVCEIGSSEVFIAILACGIPSTEMSVTFSKRNNIEENCVIFD